MGVENYQQITIRSGERYFFLYCTQDSLQNRRDEIILWADQLARRLHWRSYDTTVTPASNVQANKRLHALFEHRFPVVMRPSSRESIEPLIK
jgi:hypothetical protein